MSLDIIKKRLRAFLVPSPPKPALLAGRRFAESLRADGSWSDIDYYCPPVGPLTFWPASEHLGRTFTLAQSRHGVGELEDPLRRAFNFWLSRDFDAPDRRRHAIETPRLAGEIALLAEPDLARGALSKASEILARSRWEYWSDQDADWRNLTGTSLVATAYNLALRGCLEDSSTLVGEAFERVYREIRLARGAGEDGIQVDMSFHQDGAQLHSGEGGLDFTLTCARFIALGHATRWQAPTERIELFAAHLLDGQQWMIRGDAFDPGIAVGDPAANRRDLAPLAAAVDRLAHLANTPRRPELSALSQRLHGLAAPLSGHRHFWRSDLTVHCRPAFGASVRMGSGRASSPAGARAAAFAPAAAPAEAVRPGLPVGLMHLWRAGADGADVSQVWDWLRLPGVTCAQPLDPASPETAWERGQDPVPHNVFVGGASEGDYGCAALELAGDSVTGRKGWFFFDEAVVCLGADLRGAQAHRSVFTSVEQCLWRTPVRALCDNRETVTLSEGEHDLSGAYRVEHDGVFYYFPVPLGVTARLGLQTGRRPPCGAGAPGAVPAAEPEAQPVFNLWIDHGAQPYGASYAYVALPVGHDPEAAIRARSELGQIDILANTPEVQAVRHRRLRMVQAAFWQPGEVAFDEKHHVAVNQPCLLICRETSGGMRLTIANPRREPLTVHVEYGNRCLCFDLPAGEFAGRSVSRVI